jgi:hypothetical protein
LTLLPFKEQGLQKPVESPVFPRETGFMDKNASPQISSALVTLVFVLVVALSATTMVLLFDAHPKGARVLLQLIELVRPKS